MKCEDNHPLSLSVWAWSHLEYEASHLGDLAGLLLEALEEVSGQDEISLLPPGEDFIPLLPQQPFLDAGVLAVKKILSSDV